MGDAADDGRRSPGEYIEQALIEAHHLANLTGLDAAELARRRLVNAQSATRRTKTRDLLVDACEYLELARLERHDTAAGFAKARRYARNAEFGLRHEGPTSVEKSVEELLHTDPTRGRRSLEELRREAAVGSYDRLRRETALDLAFAKIRSEMDDGGGDDEGAEDAGQALDTAEEALRMASLEVDIRRAIQNAREARAESEFQFLSAEQLRPAGES